MINTLYMVQVLLLSYLFTWWDTCVELDWDRSFRKRKSELWNTYNDNSILKTLTNCYRKNDKFGGVRNFYNSFQIL